MDSYIEYLQRLISTDYTAESIFKGSLDNWFTDQKNLDISAICAATLGVVDDDGELITIERLAGNSYIPINKDAYGLYIPSDVILNRPAYKWLARLTPQQMLSSDTNLGKIMLVSTAL